MNINKTLVAYQGIKKMNYLTKVVHEYALLSGWMDTQEKPLMKAVRKIMADHDEMLIETFTGKFINKMPNLYMGIRINEHEHKYARAVGARLFVQVLIDNGFLDVEKRVEPVTSKGQKKFHTRQYIQMGGSYTKDLLNGYENKPGVVNQKHIKGWKLNAEQVAFLRMVSSVPFCVSDVCTEELLHKMYSLKTDWNRKVDKNGRVMPEDPILKRKRYKSYSDLIMSQLKDMSVFYLPSKYCDRGRVYYEAASLEGIRPHGKLAETLMIDSAVPYDLTHEDEKVLKHIIYCQLHGKVSPEEAVAKFSLEDLLEAQRIDPMDQESEKDFGVALLLNKAYKALIDFRQGNPSKFLFGYDFTNSGLLMSGVSFHSPKMMKAGNIGGYEEVFDSHTSFGEAYGIKLDRDGVKKVHQGLMHGASLQGIAKTLTKLTGEPVDVESVRAFNEQAYGTEVSNIPFIAEWGSNIVGNEQTVLRWTLPDGFSACSRAYYESVPLRVYTASGNHKEGYTSSLLLMDMPWIEDENGYPIYGKEVELGGHVYKVKQHKRGLFANITHSIDAYALRQIATAVVKSGRPILIKHDDFIAPPGAYYTIKATAKAVFEELYETNLYQSAVDEIIDNSPYDIPPVTLKMGDGACTVQESNNFLMP